jgi:hypothetical protein
MFCDLLESGSQRIHRGVILQRSLAHPKIAHECIMTVIKTDIIDRDFKLLQYQVPKSHAKPIIVYSVFLKLESAQAVHRLPLCYTVNTDR